jgi:hypothetical protein
MWCNWTLLLGCHKAEIKVSVGLFTSGGHAPIQVLENSVPYGCKTVKRSLDGYQPKFISVGKGHSQSLVTYFTLLLESAVENFS